MKVYIVIEYQIHEYDIVAVYSSREKAEAALNEWGTPKEAADGSGVIWQKRPYTREIWEDDLL